MTLASFHFLCLFLPVVLLGYYRWRRSFDPKIWLLVASLGFYALVDGRHLSLLLLSLVVNFEFSRLLLKTAGEPRRRKAWLWTGLLFNVGLLAVCKYIPSS